MPFHDAIISLWGWWDADAFNVGAALVLGWWFTGLVIGWVFDLIRKS